MAINGIFYFRRCGGKSTTSGFSRVQVVQQKDFQQVKQEVSKKLRINQIRVQNSPMRLMSASIARIRSFLIV